MQLNPKDKSLILLIATTLVVLWAVFSLLSNLLLVANFRNSDVAKIVANQDQQWINLSRPLELSDLKNRVILLDFWTYSCVSCAQALPEIKKLEERFGSKLLVIGVHSAHFNNDSNLAQIKKAVLKHEIDFPVINDSKLQIWNAFQAKTLPTFVLINTRGKIEETYSGVASIDSIKEDIKDLLEKHGTEINRDPLPRLLERYNTIGNVLTFPSKIEYVKNFSYKSRNLPVFFIANSSQNSVIATSMTGEVIVKIGSTKRDLVDGDFENAAFNNPRGMLFDSGKLYVADSGNKAIRVIDFKEEKVSTLINSGLSYPSDLEFFPNKNTLVIADAGSNRILSYNLKNKETSVLANDLAQPADLAAFGGKIYFVDTFASALRNVDQKGEVKTLADKNSGLQHPLGLTVDDTGAYVVDSFNNKIRKFDFASKQLRDFIGSKAGFDEPDGIVAVLDRFYVVDTNNNRVLAVNRGNLSAEVLDVMPPLKLPKEGFLEYLPNLQSLAKVVVKKDEEISLKIDLEKGWKINEDGPSFVNLLELTGDKQADMVDSFDWNAVKKKEMKLPKLASGKNYLLQGTIYYCEDKKGALCYIKSYEQNISAEGEGAAEIKIILGQVIPDDKDARK